MRKKELEHLLEERQQRVDLLMRRVESMEDLIRSYQAREQSVVDAMATARRAADDYLREAKERAEAILKSAHAESEAVIAKANSESDSLSKSAAEERNRLLKQTQLTLAEYEETITAYNRLIEDSAAEAIKNTNRYAALLKNKKLPVSELAQELRGAADFDKGETKVLPDTEGDPAKLMQNIYQLQNREIPEIPEKKPASEPEPEKIVIDEDDVATKLELPFFPKTEEDEEIPIYTSKQSSNPEKMPPAPGEVPRVGQIVESASGDALSLDDLLDEIIQAGDK